jgi:hypothetical protein
LNACKLLRQYIMVSDRNLHGRLCIQLMYEQTILFLVVIVQPWLNRGKDVVWLKTDHVMEEASELVHLALNFDQGSSIFLDKVDVRNNLVLEVFILHIELVDHMLLLQHLEKLLAVVETIKVRNSVVNVILKAFQLVKSLISEVLWWRSVVLDALQIADYLLGIGLLFVDDALEHVELLVYLLGDLFLEALLVEDAMLHL